MNKLLYGDNLDMLAHHVADESVDLVYLDPPFKSDADYNLLFREQDGQQSSAQIQAFTDTWRWSLEAEQAFYKLLRHGPQQLVTLMQALREFLKPSDMLAYLVMMAPRLVELHRVLKPTGSLYLHCDSTASHYLKLLLDAVFEPTNFRNEVIWKRHNSRSTDGRWPRIHDTLLFYSKGKDFTFNAAQVPGDKTKIPHTLITGPDGKKYQTYELTGPGKTQDGESGRPWRGFDPSAMGRHWANAHAVMDGWDAVGLIHWPKNGGFPRRRAAEPFVSEARMVAVGDVWTDIDRLNQAAKERLGYPTQKPEALLERMILASSDEGGVVLDPFCGCGTSITVAERLKRRWVGIDVTHLAISIMRQRLRDTFGSELSPYEVIGEPTDVAGARALAGQDRYQFQWWVVGKLGVRPAQDKKKGADSGVDGYHLFLDGGRSQKLIVQVKSGHVKVGDIRDLKGTMEREKSAIGAFVTLEPATKPMLREAAQAGFYHSTWFPTKQFPRLQIITVEELLAGRKIIYPELAESVYKQAVRQSKGGAEQGALFAERLAG